MKNDTIRIYFTPNDGTAAVLTSVVHRYNVADEVTRIMRWGGSIKRIEAGAKSSEHAVE